MQQFPDIRFRSTALRRGAGDRWGMDGELTIRDVTKPVVLDVEFCGAARDPWDNTRGGILATTEINREDFDVTWNQALETGGFLVGKGVRIELDVEAVYQG